MNYPNWLVEILRHPETKQPLTQPIPSLLHPLVLSGENLRTNKLYNKIAPFYHIAESLFGYLLAGIRMKQERKKIISLMNLKPGIRLLEVSPGSGVFHPLLRETLGKDAQIASTDLSLCMLNQCRKQHGHLQIPLIHANAEYLPFADNSFDALFHIGGINRFNQPERALNEFVRVVRKGGLVAWGDEHLSPNFNHPIGKYLFPFLNPGVHKPIPPVPDSLINIRYYEVYNGIAYFFTAIKN